MESKLIHQPKYGRVLIKRELKQSKSSLIIPENTAKRNAPCTGVIVALGETAGWTEAYQEDGSLKPVRVLNIGDKVMFGRHSGAWLDATIDNKGQQIDDGTLFICADEDILTVIKE